MCIPCPCTLFYNITLDTKNAPTEQRQTCINFIFFTQKSPPNRRGQLHNQFYTVFYYLLHRTTFCTAKKTTRSLFHFLRYYFKKTLRLLIFFQFVHNTVNRYSIQSIFYNRSIGILYFHIIRIRTRRGILVSFFTNSE